MNTNIVHENDSKQVPDICGKILELLNQENSDCKLMSIATVLINSGEISKLHYHKIMEEIYYIVEGNAEITINNDKAKMVYAGHAILIPAGITHQIKNTGNNTLKFISIDSPPFLEEDIYFE